MQEIEDNPVSTDVFNTNVSVIQQIPARGNRLLPFPPSSKSAARFSGLLTNRLLVALPGSDFARLLQYLEPVTLVAESDMVKFGESAEFVYFPETAVISQLHLLEDGNTSAAAIIGKEGLIGLSAILDSRPALYWSHVTIGGSAVCASVEVIRKEFARGSFLQKVLLAYAQSRLTQLSQQAVCNGRHLMFDRLCTWLLMVHDRAGNQALPLTHEKIAQHLGARRAGVTSSCHTLRDQNVIRYQRGMITICDRERLETMACECYGVMKQLGA